MTMGGFSGLFYVYFFPMSHFLCAILEFLCLEALFGYRVGRCRCRDPNDRPLIEIIFLSFCHFLVLLSFDKYSAAVQESIVNAGVHIITPVIETYRPVTNSTSVHHRCFNTIQSSTAFKKHSDSS